MIATPEPGRMLVVGGRRVHCHAAGAGPAIVLLHGASSHSADFMFGLFQRLARDFRAVAFDRPGLGLSEALHPDGETFAEQAAHLDAACELLGVERAIILGHSFGAGVCMAWALERPERVAALVTIAGVTMPWPRTMESFLQLAAREPDGATLARLISVTTERAFTHSPLETIFAPQPVLPGYAEALRLPAAYRRSAFRANARQVARLRTEVEALAPRYPSLALPVEVLHGTHDAVGSIMVHARAMARSLPDARLTELPGLGHMLHLVAQDDVLAAVARARVRAGLR